MKRPQFLSLLLGLAGGLIAVALYAALAGNPKTAAYFPHDKTPVGFAGLRSAVTGEMTDFEAAAATATPAVVHIQSSGGPVARNNSDRIPDDFPFRDFFDGFEGRGMPSLSSGSGVILSADGYIVTNHHVIDNADKFEVTLHDNRKFEATLIGSDPSTDLAVLKIDESGLPFLQFGSSDELRIGQWVLAVGNPFNLTSTVTAGIVSAKGRSIDILRDKFKIESFIQTDAAVNPGNSGGALVNTRGELVGVNTAIASRTGSFAGYSFAVPSEIVKKVVDDLKTFGAVQRGILGVVIEDVTADLAEREDLDVTKGVYIREVNDGSAAEEAGMKRGDVITDVNGVAVGRSSELQEQIGRKRPGDKVNVGVLRDGKPLKLDVTLKNKSGNTSKVTADAGGSRKLGGTIEELSRDDQKKLGVKYGVKVTDVQAGVLRRAGVRPGFVITHIDKEPVRSVDEAAERLADREEGAILLEGVYGPNQKAAYALVF